MDSLGVGLFKFEYDYEGKRIRRLVNYPYTDYWDKWVNEQLGIDKEGAD